MIAIAYFAFNLCFTLYYNIFFFHVVSLLSKNNKHSDVNV